MDKDRARESVWKKEHTQETGLSWPAGSQSSPGSVLKNQSQCPDTHQIRFLDQSELHSTGRAFSLNESQGEGWKPQHSATSVGHACCTKA